MTIDVREARPDDRAKIVDFNARLALETEAKGLDPAVLERGVARALADPERLRYWIAESEGRAVGQAAITREWSDWRDGWLWWLQSVYVIPEARGRGVFRALFQEIRRLGRLGPEVIGLRLYVEAGNENAQRTYRALGLEPAGYHVFEELWIEPLKGPSD